MFDCENWRKNLINTLGNSVLILNNPQVSQYAFSYILHLHVDGTTAHKTLKPMPGDSFSQEAGFLSAEKSCQKVSLIAFRISPLPLNIF